MYFTFLDDKLIVPVCWRKGILEFVHEGHHRIEKMKMKFRECIYWPWISKDIETISENCNLFQKFKIIIKKGTFFLMLLPKARAKSRF